MSKPRNIRQCNSSTFLFFERSKSENVVAQATKRQREEIGNPVIEVKAPDKTATTSKANIISYNICQKEKVAFELNYLNDKKAR